MSEEKLGTNLDAILTVMLNTQRKSRVGREFLVQCESTLTLRELELVTNLRGALTRNSKSNVGLKIRLKRSLNSKVNITLLELSGGNKLRRKTKAHRGGAEAESETLSSKNGTNGVVEVLAIKVTSKRSTDLSVAGGNCIEKGGSSESRGRRENREARMATISEKFSSKLSGTLTLLNIVLSLE